MSKPHVHVFDSQHGFVAGRRRQALLCRCGNWGMPGGGEWRVVPTELLPQACKTLSWFHRVITGNTFAIAVIALLVMLLFW